MNLILLSLEFTDYKHMSQYFMGHLFLPIFIGPMLVNNIYNFGENL